MPADSGTPSERGAALDSFLRNRRTSLLVDPERDVPRTLVAELADAARWAPCHKRTWPWRFCAFTGEGRRRLGQVCADVLEAAGVDTPKVDKARTKYLRAPVVLVVGSAPDPDPVRHAENRDATAAAVQNLLLAATARGLASFWSSPYPQATEALNELCGFEAGTGVVAVVYLGWPSAEVAVPERPPATVTWVDT
jgi:nitroreductase